MTSIQALILGLLQGFTEFLPVSSSGHLALGQHWLGVAGGEGLAFEVLVHLATTLVVIVVFRDDLIALARYVFAEAPGRLRAAGWRAAIWDHPQGRLLGAIVVISIPTAIAGLTLEDRVEWVAGNPRAVGAALLATAALLWSTRGARARFEGYGAIPLWAMIVVGLAQSVAITPGISRSGATICAALLCGVDRRTAGALSFLAAIPAILGAAQLEIDGSILDPAMLAPSAIGFVAAGVSGGVALVVLLRFVGQGRLWWFAPYCAAVGLLALLL